MRNICTFSCFILVSSIQSNSQVKPKDVDLIFSRTHYSFTIIPFLDQKASITRNIDKYWIHATIMHGFEAGFSRYSHFDKEHSLIIGLFFGAFARNFNYDIPGKEFNPPHNGNFSANSAVTREFNFMGSIPILFEKRWIKQANKYWNVNAGITIRYTPSLDEEFGGAIGGQPDFIDMQINDNYTKKPWLNFNIGGGYCWILGNNNIFKTNMVVNWSFTSFLRGTYQFNFPNQPTVEGIYEVNGSYVGLSLSYIFTRSNKKQNKEQENKKAF
jgi:hypothetical protein